MNTAADPSTEHFKLRHVHAITGNFVLITLVILIGVIIFAGRSQRWFIGNVTLSNVCSKNNVPIIINVVPQANGFP